ncbi:MAG TPA: hypothetical protein VGC76_03000 [Pyrinomonadaceae bacterium]|jgi:hypothetical protein
MLSVTSLKIVKKLSILCVLTFGLFAAVSVNQNTAAASFCCSSCEPDYKACKSDCRLHYPQNPSKYEQCVEENCDPVYGYCQNNCDPLC